MDKFVVAIKKVGNKKNDLLDMLLEANSHRQVDISGYVFCVVLCICTDFLSYFIIANLQR